MDSKTAEEVASLASSLQDRPAATSWARSRIINETVVVTSPPYKEGQT